MKRILVWVQNKEENPQDQNQVLSETKNEVLVTKENMLRGKVLLEEKFKSLPSKQEKVLKKPNKILGVTTPTPLGKISSPRFQLILK